MTTANSTIQLISQKERIKRYGIECIGPAGDGILFKAGTWRPGGEYIQKLIVRNVSNSVKKLKYKLPSTRYFSLAYPEEIVLSPGIFKELDVVFRPVEYEPYDDAMYIKMLDGIPGNGFHVPVRATIDKLSLNAPTGLDLGYCTTHQITTIVFDLINDGEVDASYEWEVPKPFVLTPSSGVIPPGGKHAIEVRIRPEEASVFVSQAICHVGRNVHDAIIPNPIITTKLSAIAKFAYITLSEDSISFEEVVSGMIPATQEVVLRNNSVVPAEFQLIRFDSDREEVFSIRPKMGVIPPRSEISVYVDYNALAMGCFSLERYAFRTPGNCTTVLTVKGLSMPPQITLCKDKSLIKPSSITLASKTAAEAAAASQSGSLMVNGQGEVVDSAAPEFSLNFRDVEIGKVETRIFHLRNNSNRDTAFSIIGDDNGLFKMYPKQGIIPALFKQFAVRVIFTPSKPINYYRRFFVLVGDALPLFYDCLGTGYIRAKGEVKEQRPAPLRHAHVQAFRNRSAQGYGVLSPDELDRMYDEEQGISPARTLDATSINALLAVESNNVMTSSFFAQTGRIGTRALSVATLQRPVTRTGEAVRHAVAPAHELFVHEAADGINDPNTPREVFISRSSIDFDYTGHNQVSGAKIVTIYNRTHAKVIVQWEVPVAAGMNESKNGVVLLPGEHARDAHVITEEREQRKLFLKQAFQVTPMTGEINPQSSQTFQIAFCPKQSNRNYTSELEAYVFFKNQRTFRLVNDHSLTPPWCLTVNCMGHTFQTGQLLAKALICGGCVKGGKLVFPCCFSDEAIYETFMVRNTSNLPCTYHIDIGFEEGGNTRKKMTSKDEIFSVKPTVGEIAANDFTLVCVRFAPNEQRKYLELLRIYVNGQQGGKLLLEGCGAMPYVTLPDMASTHTNPESPEAMPMEHVWGVPSRPPSIIPKGPQGTFWLKPTCVGLSNKRPFRLKNSSRLPLRYRVSLNSAAAGICSVSPASGVMKGNEETTLQISFAPRKAVQYDFKLSIFVYPIGGKCPPVTDAMQPGAASAPELLQSLSINISGLGDNTAMIFDPSRITADVRLVNTSEEKVIYLENVSDSDLSYKLFYKEEFEPDVGSLHPERTISDIQPMVPLSNSFDKQQPLEPEETGREETVVMKSSSRPATASMVHSLFCAQPEGVLPARSRTRVIFTYNPRKAGLFEFLIYSQVQALDSDGSPVLISNDEAALLRMGTVQSEEDIAMFDSDAFAMLPLMSNITARAAFPKLLFEDIRCESDILISDITSIWKRFSFSQINYDLAIPMTADEVAANEASTPDSSLFRTYNFDFQPAVVGSPEQSMCIRLTNSGYLTTSFSMHLPNEKQLELEAWCDEEEPSEELNRLVAIIEELKLFTIEPRHGVLQPGESCMLRVSYHHTSLKYEGFHNLPVQMQLQHGKQFYLNLQGITLPLPHATNPMYRKKLTSAPTAQSNVMSHVGSATSAMGNENPAMTPAATQRHMESLHKELLAISKLSDFLLVLSADQDTFVRLSPVPIGLASAAAPLQRTEIVNVSNVSVDYEVDLQPLEQLVADNFHQPVIVLANPVGTVPANDSIFLEWYFFPLEAKTYEFSLNVKYISSPPIIPDRTGSFAIPSSRKSNASMGSRTATAASVASRGRQSSSAQYLPTVSVPTPTPQYMNFTVQCPGYDPRDGTKPKLLESTYLGGLPPAFPALQLPQQKLLLSQDSLDFATVPQHCSSKRVTFITNTSSSATYEFVIDESSCSLCIDGLLTVTPLVARVDPGSTVAIEFSMVGYSQSMIFTHERVKVMVREVIRGAAPKRSSARDTLMKKIKNKKTSSMSLHESVVSRPTFSRSAQLELNPVPDGMRAKLPSTIGSAGELITNAVHPAIKLMKLNQGSVDGSGSAELLAPGSASGSFIEDPGEIPSGFHIGSSKGGNKISEIDVLGDRSSTAFRVKSSNVGFVQTPAGERGATAHSERGHTNHSRTASGAASSRSVLSSSRTSVSQRESAPLLGPPSVMIIRLSGEVYPISTVRDVFERTGEIDVMNSFVLPEQQAFIPPVGKKFFDQEFMNEQEQLKNKSRINLSFVRNRDHELRHLTEHVADALLRSLLSVPELDSYLKATLSNTTGATSGTDSSSSKLPIAADYTLPLASTTDYGVFFSEIQAQRSLVSKFVIELKHLGFRDIFSQYKIQMLASRPSTASEMDLLKFHRPNSDRLQSNETQAVASNIPMQWLGAGDETLRSDENTFCLPCSHIPKALLMLGITSEQHPALFDSVIECMSNVFTDAPFDLAFINVSVKHNNEENEDNDDYESQSFNALESNAVVNVAEMLHQLPVDEQLILHQRLDKLYDARRLRRRAHVDLSNKQNEKRPVSVSVETYTDPSVVALDAAATDAANDTNERTLSSNVHNSSETQLVTNVRASIADTIGELAAVAAEVITAPMDEEGGNSPPATPFYDAASASSAADAEVIDEPVRTAMKNHQGFTEIASDVLNNVLIDLLNDAVESPEVF